jgi:hypothetical protein
LISYFTGTAIDILKGFIRSAVKGAVDSMEERGGTSVSLADVLSVSIPMNLFHFAAVKIFLAFSLLRLAEIE